MNLRLFSPIQRSLLDMLSDGMPHKRPELLTCLDDPLATPIHLNSQIVRMRKVLRCHGEDIICEAVNRTIAYRHVRLLGSAYNGYR